MKKTYSGTDGTVGFVSAWESDNKDVGIGEQEIKKITEGERIDFELRFFEPFESTDPAYMTTESVSENQTKVKWGFNGHMDYPMNIMMLFIDFEKMIILRLICITSLGINDSRFRLGLYYSLFVIPFILFFYFLDKSKQEKLIMNSKLDWTIVRPGQLTNGKKRLKYILTKMISRADVAHFMLSQLHDKTYIRKIPGIVNR